MIGVSTSGGLKQRPVVRQFIKFCIIGFSSMIIDVGISYSLLYVFHLVQNPTLAKTISFLFAVTNGFFWNTRWTFRGMGSGRKHEMYVKFMLVNCVGLVLNILIFKGVLFFFTGRFIGQGKPSVQHFGVATAAAVVCVAIWNFTANRYWTFRKTAANMDGRGIRE